MIYFNLAQDDGEKLKVQRLLCKGCRHSHAYLPDFIVPFVQLTVGAILCLLKEYYSHKDNVASLCERLCIDARTLYHYRSVFLEHKALWLGILEDSLTKAEHFLVRIASPEHDYSSFNMKFLRRTTFSFLQSHDNPANCRYPRF